MADLSTRRNPVDARQVQIRLRRMKHEANAMRVSVEKFEIDILEAEANIGRLHESINATNDRICDKEAELVVATAALNEAETEAEASQEE